MALRAELADGSIVFRFGHRPEALEPEQTSHGPGASGEDGPDATVSLASDATDEEAPERAVSPNSGAVTEGRLTAGDAILAGESEELDGDGDELEAGVVALESTATGSDVREGSDDASTVAEEATATAGLEESEEVSEGSTVQDFDTDVDTESTGSSTDEQGTQFGAPRQPVVCQFSCVLTLTLQQTSDVQ